jgi:hypothetical protein
MDLVSALTTSPRPPSWDGTGRRGHGVVHHVQDAALAAQFADALQVRHLCADWRWFRRTPGGYWRDGRFHILHIGGIHHGHLGALRAHCLPQAVGIAEQESRGHHMVALAQQRLDHGADGAHAGGEADGGRRLPSW